jgi:4-hydroxy-tetrahydrodipicolinate synthase
MKSGYVPAVGTPLDKNGNLCVESYKKQIDDQIEHGAIAILSMGSMGIQPYMRTSVCPDVAKAAVEATAGRVPVYVGAMDCSIARARERMAAMEDLDIAGFVLTTPYYYACTPQMIINYYKGACAGTKHKVLMYDLAVVTQSKITYEIVKELIRTVPNLAGIKSADMNMFRKLKLDPEVPEDFLMVYSGLDNFDIAYKWGIDKCLDGMPACTPVNSGKLFTAMKNGDYDKAAEYLNNIIALRDLFVARDLWPSFSTAMNLLGYEGNFAPDYVSPIKEEYIEEIKNELVRIGEL